MEELTRIKGKNVLSFLFLFPEYLSIKDFLEKIKKTREIIDKNEIKSKFLAPKMNGFESLTLHIGLKNKVLEEKLFKMCSEIETCTGLTFIK